MEPIETTTPPASRWRAPSGSLTALFGLALLAAAWLDTLQRTATDRAAEIERVHRENDGLARAFEEHALRMLSAADNALLFLKNEYEARGRVTQAMSAFVARAKDTPLLEQINVADENGDLVLSALPNPAGMNIADRAHFRAHLAGDTVGTFVGAPIRTRLSGKWSFFLTRRLNRPDGSFAGVASVGINSESVSDYYQHLEFGDSRGVLLVGRDGIVRARRFQKQTEIGQDLRSSPMFARIPREPAGHYQVAGTIDGQSRFVSYRALRDFPLVVAVSDLSAAALAPFERRAAIARRDTLIFSLFVVAACLVLIMADRRARRRSAELAAELAERRRAEEALRENQDLFAAFLDNVPAAVFVQDLQGTVLYSNQAYRDLPDREAIGRHARVLLAPAGAAGAPPPVLRGRAIAIDEPVGDGADGTRVFETRMFVVDRAGKEPLLGCVSVDATGRRNAEAERLTFERRMQQTQKLESLGVLAGGIAHDFNNLLMVILGNTDLAFARTPPESPLRPLLANIETTAQRAADLTNQMLAYSGKGRFTVEPISLTRLVEELGHLLATVISKRAVVAYHLDPALPAIDADATQVRQVVMNLITNASDALGGREGAITVTTRVAAIAHGAPEAGVMDHHLPPGRYAAVEVSDTGCGMDEATLGRIFDPFFTTKQAGRGLGLASVLGIVRGHRGGIRVQSSPGVGTTFSVLFPFAPHAVSAAGGMEMPVAARSSDAPRSRVLVVDDECDVRSTAQAMLEQSGFEVVAAADGAEGVEVFRAQHGQLGAVLLDMTMPRMGGEEAFLEMRRIDPAVPVIIMSGFDEQEAVARLEGAGLAGFIRKPYRLQALVAKLRDAMAGGGVSQSNRS